MKPTAKVDITNFSKVVRELSRISGSSQRDIIRAEAQQILSKTARGTRTASLKSIKKRHSPIWNKDGGQKWAKVNGKLYYLPNRLPDAVFSQVDARGKEKVKKVSASRGWARRGWQAIGQALRLNISVPAYVQKATVKGTHIAEVVEGSERERNRDYTLTIGNSSKIAKRLSLGRVIGAAMKGRIQYFHQNFRRGVFRDIQNRAKRYPGITFR